MPVETLRPSSGRLAGGPFTSAMPFRILNKGPDYFRRQMDPGARKLSAVERLEADKAKYVKSQQVALTRQAPIQPPIIRKPLLSPGMMLQCRISTPPARKVPRRPADTENGGGGMGGEGGGRRGPHLNLEILNNLINNVCEGPVSSSASASSPSSGAKSIGSSLSTEQERSARHLLNNHTATTSSSTSSCTSSSPLNTTRSQAPPDLPSRRPPPVPARGLRIGPPAPYSSPNSVTVRRVDVRPQVEVRKPQRPQLLPKPQLQPKPQPQVKPRQTAQPQVPLPPQQPPPQTPTKSLPTPLPYLPPSPMLFRAGMMPPASPAFTRLSSASSRGSRKHPSLHRSKSDLSDRYSRATADLERFFNYCGLDPQEVEGLGGVERFARANSDIVSINKLRSVSTPSSEGGEGDEQPLGEQQEEEGPPGANERIPYGISVIERNARVIKWLYGIRQARDSSGVSNV